MVGGIDQEVMQRIRYNRGTTLLRTAQEEIEYARRETERARSPQYEPKDNRPPASRNFLGKPRCTCF